MKNIEYVRPQDIEKRSFAIISKELEEKGMLQYSGRATEGQTAEITEQGNHARSSGRHGLV